MKAQELLENKSATKTLSASVSGAHLKHMHTKKDI
jgi:hypothetical protein